MQLERSDSTPDFAAADVSYFQILMQLFWAYQINLLPCRGIAMSRKGWTMSPWLWTYAARCLPYLKTPIGLVPCLVAVPCHTPVCELSD